MRSSFLLRNPWTPLAEMARLREEMNRLLGGYREGIETETQNPSVNLWTSDEGVLMTAELPGVRLEDLDLTVHGETVTLQGQWPRDGSERGSMLQSERPTGKFTRTVTLPFEVEPEACQATMHDGILRVEMKRPPAACPRKITIKR